MHGYFLIKHTKSLIPQYPTPNISKPSLAKSGRAHILMDTAGNPMKHKAPQDSQLPEPLSWGESKLGTVS